MAADTHQLGRRGSNCERRGARIGGCPQKAARVARGGTRELNLDRLRRKGDHRQWFEGTQQNTPPALVLQPLMGSCRRDRHGPCMTEMLPCSSSAGTMAEGVGQRTHVGREQVSQPGPKRCVKQSERRERSKTDRQPCMRHCLCFWKQSQFRTGWRHLYQWHSRFHHCQHCLHE